MKYKELLESTPKVSKATIPNSKDLTSAKIDDVIYDEGRKLLTFYVEIVSATHKGRYTSIIEFSGVEKNQGLTEEEIANGFKPKASINDNDVSIRCGCTSYRFRFDHANRLAKSGTGPKFPLYHRISDRKPNNPYDYPGLCKHVIKAIEYLSEQGFLIK